MNPEFQRNLWLAMSPARVIAMPVIVFAILFLSHLTGGMSSAAGTAQTLFWIIVIFWGTWNAARSVIGEISDRTWDFQRLSALKPGTMVAGKLFGGTVYNWFGGVLCLIPIGLHAFDRGGADRMLIEVGYFVGLGVFAHSLALFSSLLSVRRQTRGSVVGSFFHLGVGIAAAFIFSALWEVADPRGLFGGINEVGGVELRSLTWWDMDFSTDVFVLGSLGVFLAWALLGAYRMMRREFQMQGTSLIFVAFLIFMLIYWAGFANLYDAAYLNETAVRLTIAAYTAVILTYLTGFIEPKSVVHYRWLGERLAAGNVPGFMANLPTFALSYAALVIVTLWLMVTVQPVDIQPVTFQGTEFREPVEAYIRPVMIAVLFFVLRDLGLLLFFNTGGNWKRGDFAWLITIIVGYSVVPGILWFFVSSSGLPVEIVAFFVPIPSNSAWFTLLFPLAQAVVIWMIVIPRIRGDRRAIEAAAPA